MSIEATTLQPHPIQLRNLVVRELYLYGNIAPTDVVETSDRFKYEILVATSGYLRDQKKVRVAVKIEAGMEDVESSTPPPYKIRVEIYGDFDVDEARFNPDLVEDWAAKGAIYVLYPYLREYIFGLTVRAGYRPAILDLVEIPTFSSSSEEMREKD